MSELGQQEAVLRMEGLGWREESDRWELRSMLGRHRLGLRAQAGVHMSGLFWLVGLHMLGLRSQAAGPHMLGLQWPAGLHMWALQWLATLRMWGLQWLVGLHRALAVQALKLALLPAWVMYKRPCRHAL